MASRTMENYLKQLYIEEQATPRREGAPPPIVAMGKLATAMRVVPGTATTMVKALADAQLVQYAPRGGVRLTDTGRQLALHVLRRHRLVELFLVKTLGLDWSEVHAEAEELEHVISDKVLARIDILLGHPDADPHGDPIPQANGQLPQFDHDTLVDCPLGTPMRVARVLDQETPFLQFVNQCGLTPGTLLVVEDRNPQADSVRVQPTDHPAVTLSTAAAAKFEVTIA